MSIPWSPPELFTNPPRVDVRSDLFSLAATLYSLLAGQTPFERPGQRNTADRKSTRLNSSHVAISYAVFCLKKKNEFKSEMLVPTSRIHESLMYAIVHDT